MTTHGNWAGNVQYTAREMHTPHSVPELQELVADHPHIRAIGTRHSFNTLGDCPGTLVSLQHLRRVCGYANHGNHQQVTIEAGTTFGQLAPEITGRGFALANLPSLIDVSVIGACATATHGSGTPHLGTSVTGLELVTASGESVNYTDERNSDIFGGLVVSLGMLGVASRATLRMQPAYDVRQFVFEHVPYRELLPNLSHILQAAYSVSIFTDWKSMQTANQVWLKQRCDDLVTLPFSELTHWFGGTAATTDRHPVAGLSPEPCTPQCGRPGPWHERLPHFRTGATPSVGKELQSEYFVPIEHGQDAILAVLALAPVIAPHVYVSEIRLVLADDQWLSPHYERDNIGIHFTWKPDWAAVRSLLPMIEACLSPYGVRPHWGKLNTLDPAVIRQAFPRFRDFLNLRSEMDPHGKFGNPFVDRIFS